MNLKLYKTIEELERLLELALYDAEWYRKKFLDCEARVLELKEMINDLKELK